MNLLLDTHTFIWFLNGDSRLSTSINNKITDTSNKCFISIATIWEIAIKTSIGKLELKGTFADIAAFAFQNEIETLPISFEHLKILMQLDFHHRDPFDRIIISQAIQEGFTIATIDGNFKQYPVKVTWS